MIHMTNMRVNIITSAISLTKIHFIIRKLFRIFKHKYDDFCTSRNSFWMITQIDDNTLALSEHRELVPKFRSKGRDFGEKERRGENEKEGRQRWSRSGIRCSYSRTRWCSHPVRVRFTTLGPSARTAKTGRIPRNNGLSIAVSCQQVRVAKSQFMEYMCAHVSFVVPVIDSAITEYIFTSFFSSAIK